jgi:hypothetical protein
MIDGGKAQPKLMVFSERAAKIPLINEFLGCF